MDVTVPIKAILRVFAALFAAFAGTLFFLTSFCAAPARHAWTGGFCAFSPTLAPFVLLFTTFVLFMLMLSRDCANLRRPLAVAALLAYTVWSASQAIHQRVWWWGFLPLACVTAAAGVILRARWGAWAMHAITAVLVASIAWGTINAIRSGYFGSVRPLEAALSLVPGLSFLWVAAFCSYVAATMQTQRTPSPTAPP